MSDFVTLILAVGSKNGASRFEIQPASQEISIMLRRIGRNQEIETVFNGKNLVRFKLHSFWLTTMHQGEA